MHDEAGGCGWNCPLPHGVHTPLCGYAENVSAGHGLHRASIMEEAPHGPKVPAGHPPFRASTQEVAPGVAAKVPAVQTWHSCWPDRPCARPTWQGAQVAC